MMTGGNRSTRRKTTSRATRLP